MRDVDFYSTVQLFNGHTKEEFEELEQLEKEQLKSKYPQLLMEIKNILQLLKTDLNYQLRKHIRGDMN